MVANETFVAIWDQRRNFVTQDRSDWLILLVAGTVSAVLLLAVSAHNAMADVITFPAPPIFQPAFPLVY